MPEMTEAEASDALYFLLGNGVTAEELLADPDLPSAARCLLMEMPHA